MRVSRFISGQGYLETRVTRAKNFRNCLCNDKKGINTYYFPRQLHLRSGVARAAHAHHASGDNF